MIVSGRVSARWRLSQEAWRAEADHSRLGSIRASFPGGRLIYPGNDFYYVPGQGFLPTSQPLASPGLYTTTKFFPNFAPRFGFAWRPFGNDRTALRGSYGIFTEEPNENNNIYSIGNPPFVVQQSLINNIPTPSFVWSNLFPAAAGAGSAAIATAAAYLPAGYVQQWTLNMERELGPGIVMEIGYTASKGTSLDMRHPLNQAVLDADPSHPTPVGSRLPYPAFAAGLDEYDHVGFSTYEGLIARLEKRFSHGLQFLAAYTYSKSIDNSS